MIKYYSFPKTIIKSIFLLIVFFAIGLISENINTWYVDSYKSIIYIDNSQVATYVIGILTVHTTISILALTIYQITLSINNNKIIHTTYYKYLFTGEKIFIGFTFFEIFIVILGTIIINVFFALKNEITALYVELTLTIILIIFLYKNTVFAIMDEKELRRRIFNFIKTNFIQFIKKNLKRNFNPYDNECMEKFRLEYFILSNEVVEQIKSIKDKKNINNIQIINENLMFLIDLDIYLKEVIEHKYIIGNLLDFFHKKECYYNQFKELIIELGYTFESSIIGSLEVEELLQLSSKLKNKYFFEEMLDGFNPKTIKFDNMDKISEPYRIYGMLKVICYYDKNGKRYSADKDEVSLEIRIKWLKEINIKQINLYFYFKYQKKIIVNCSRLLESEDEIDIEVLRELLFILQDEFEKNVLISKKEFCRLYNIFLLKEIKIYKDKNIRNAVINNQLNRLIEDLRKDNLSSNIEVIISITKKLIDNNYLEYFFHIYKRIQKDFTYKETCRFYIEIAIYLFEMFCENKRDNNFIALSDSNFKAKFLEDEKKKSLTFKQVLITNMLNTEMIKNEIVSSIDNTTNIYFDNICRYVMYFGIVYNPKFSLELINWSKGISDKFHRNSIQFLLNNEKNSILTELFYYFIEGNNSIGKATLVKSSLVQQHKKTMENMYKDITTFPKSNQNPQSKQHKRRKK